MKQNANMRFMNNFV